MKEKTREFTTGYYAGRRPGYQGQERPPTPKLYRGVGYSNKPTPSIETKNETPNE